MLNLMKRLVMTALCLSLALPSCGKKAKDDGDSGDSADGAPPPPSPYTVSLDLSVADGGTNTDSTAAGQGLLATTQLAHAGASLVVLGVSYSLAAQLIVPVLLLREAAKASPTEVTPGSYLWSYDFTYGGAKYTGNLTGTKDEASGTNSFSMSVTRDPANGDGCCTNFVFFTGTNNPSDGGGSWQIFDPTRPTGQEMLFSVTYGYKSATERTLAYAVNSDRDAAQKFGNGTTVLYNVKDTVVTMTYKDSSETGSRIVSWDRDTLAGSIVDLQGQKLCWDTKANGYTDIACP